MKTQAALAATTAALVLVLAGLAFVVLGGTSAGASSTVNSPTPVEVEFEEIDAHREGGRVELVDPTAPPSETALDNGTTGGDIEESTTETADPKAGTRGDTTEVADAAPGVDANEVPADGTGGAVDREPPFPAPEPPAGSDQPPAEEAGDLAPNTPTCAAPTELVDGECVPPVIIDCAPGFKLVDGECIFNGVILCPAGFTVVDGECVAPVIIDCAPGFKLVDGECTPIISILCAPGFKLVDGECTPIISILCAPGFKLVDGECIFNPPTFELQILTPGA